MFCLNNRDQSNTNNNGNSNGFTWCSSGSTTTGTTWNTNTFNVNGENNSVSAVNRNEAGLANTLMYLPQNKDSGRQYRSAYGGGVSRGHMMPDPHLTCLKLGKRHYFEDVSGGSGGLAGEKKGKGGYCGGGGKTAAVGGGYTAVTRCQVDGCNVALMNAKEYHRRHKVCEMHSKAPKVVVLGLEQRFCQQCSRSVCYSVVIS